MKLFKIKQRFTGTVIFKLECNSLKVCVEVAIETGANLDGANLVRANLDGANLVRANLDGANLVRANLYGANLYGANLDGANLDGANLDGANLVRANLVRANLVRANLVRANLVRANLGNDIKINKNPLQIHGLHWPILIFDSHMKIGCEFHSIKEWNNFSDDGINSMDSNALEFWKQNKSAIMAICEANSRI